MIHKATTIIAILMLTIIGSATAQDNPFNKKKTVKEIRASLKVDNYAQADNQINKAMTSWEEAKTDIDLNYMMMNAQNGLAKAENRKIFLRNNPDTAKYFSYIYKVYQYALLTDSLDRVPDEKGRVRPRYTASVASQLSSYRNNIKSGGKFFYKKQKYDDAYKYLDMYLATQHQPALSSLKSYTPDKDSLDLARMAVYSAYNAGHYADVMKYLPMCMDDTTELAYLCQLGCNAQMAVGDTLKALEYLYEGWKIAPSDEYFYITLLDYYINRKQYQKAYDIVTTQLRETPDSRLLWYIRGKCEQCLDAVDASIYSYTQAIRLQDDDAKSYSSLGGIYIDKARKIYDHNNYAIGTKEYSQAKKEQDELYGKARTYLEAAQKFSPDDPTLWIEGLKEVYYKLNMGKELKALETLK